MATPQDLQLRALLKNASALVQPNGEAEAEDEKEETPPDESVSRETVNPLPLFPLRTGEAAPDRKGE